MPTFRAPFVESSRPSRMSVAVFRNPPVVSAPRNVERAATFELVAALNLDASNVNVPVLSNDTPSAASDETPEVPVLYTAIWRRASVTVDNMLSPFRTPFPLPRLLSTSLTTPLYAVTRPAKALLTLEVFRVMVTVLATPIALAFNRSTVSPGDR